MEKEYLICVQVRSKLHSPCSTGQSKNKWSMLSSTIYKERSIFVITFLLYNSTFVKLIAHEGQQRFSDSQHRHPLSFLFLDQCLVVWFVMNREPYYTLFIAHFIYIAFRNPWFWNPDRSMNRKKKRFKVFEVGLGSNRDDVIINLIII